MTPLETFVVTAIIIIWVILLNLRIQAHLEKKVGETSPIMEKACPPHMWRWEEQVGMEGTWFIRCQRCRRLPGWGKNEV
jgi:hypothetical protein